MQLLFMEGSQYLSILLSKVLIWTSMQKVKMMTAGLGKKKWLKSHYNGLSGANDSISSSGSSRKRVFQSILILIGRQKRNPTSKKIIIKAWNAHITCVRKVSWTVLKLNLQRSTLSAKKLRQWRAIGLGQETTIGPSKKTIVTKNRIVEHGRVLTCVRALIHQQDMKVELGVLKTENSYCHLLSLKHTKGFS